MGNVKEINVETLHLEMRKVKCSTLEKTKNCSP